MKWDEWKKDIDPKLVELFKSSFESESRGSARCAHPCSVQPRMHWLSCTRQLRVLRVCIDFPRLQRCTQALEVFPAVLHVHWCQHTYTNLQRYQILLTLNVGPVLLTLYGRGLLLTTFITPPAQP